MLQVDQLTVAYGEAVALREVSITVEAGRIVTLIGANGAGKTTLVNTIAGLLRPRHGHIRLGGIDVTTDLTTVPAHQVCSHGVALAPEGRRLFTNLTVLDNLHMGHYAPHARANAAATLDLVFTLFPILAQRRKQLAGTLSGGEQQMVAISRALLAQPKLLLLDEPSLGLAPIIVQQIFQVIKTIRQETGLTILLVEQNAQRALAVADQAYILADGQIVQTGTPAEFAADDRIQRAYLGLL